MEAIVSVQSAGVAAVGVEAASVPVSGRSRLDGSAMSDAATPARWVPVVCDVCGARLLGIRWLP